MPLKSLLDRGRVVLGLVGYGFRECRVVQSSANPVEIGPKFFLEIGRMGLGKKIGLPGKLTLWPS